MNTTDFIMLSFTKDDTQDIISELRHEISKLRNKITSASEPNRDDVAKMEVKIFQYNKISTKTKRIHKWRK